ncbi:hypothetical protein [Agromyces lapidis]|uniref:Uridine kinase n=1 Tax=Agromyces lapidis TaxID=279574 RepID=A0ABV5SPL9_9MICO|nr:hypothetical protein [Agromyces lapidis]
MSPTQSGPLPTIEWVAEEFLHNARRGRRLVAVEGADPVASARFADELAAAITARGPSVVRRSLGAVDESQLRTGLIDPFRADTLPGAEGGDVVLVADGRHLLDDAVRGVWHFSVWTLAGDELPHSGASVIVDVSDPEAPTRFYYDFCAIPSSVNRPGLH